MTLLEGLGAGIIAGIVMGTVSDAGYRIGIFKGSLFIIDGSFAQKMLHMQTHSVMTYLLGIPVHVLTSASFGAGYAFIHHIIGGPSSAGLPIGLYVFLLWLSMLFIALPVAGQGFLGKKIGRFAWLEQLVLHAIFGITFWKAL